MAELLNLLLSKRNTNYYQQTDLLVYLHYQHHTTPIPQSNSHKALERTMEEHSPVPQMTWLLDPQDPTLLPCFQFPSQKPSETVTLVNYQQAQS